MSFKIGIFLVVIATWLQQSESKSIGKEISGSIDLTDGWKPKKVKDKVEVKEFKSSAKVDKVNTKISASSGGISGVAQSGLNGASGVAQAAINMKLDKKKGVSVKISLPSGKAHAGAVGVSADLSTSIDARLKNKGIKAGIDGPQAAVKLGPVGISIGVGVGIDASGSSKEVGAVVDTPVGNFGVKAGCLTKICIFACITIKVC